MSMDLLLAKGTTSQIFRIFVKNSSVTTGAGLPGLVFNTASLVAYYMRDGDTGPTAISLATATLGSYTSGGFRECDATNFPGWYEIGIPNAAIAAGATNVTLFFFGAANMTPTSVNIELTFFNPQDQIRAGLTALPNALAAASNGLIINGTNVGTVTLETLTISNTTNFTGAVSMFAGCSISQSTSNGHGLIVSGNGTGSGLRCIGGTTGRGVQVVGGSSSGNGIEVTTTSGSAVRLVPGGTNVFGLFIQASGSSSSGIGISAANAGVLIAGTATDISLIGGAAGISVAGTTAFTGATIFTGALTAANASNNIVGIDVAKIDGDADSAEALSFMLNGTGGTTLTLDRIIVTHNVTAEGAVEISNSAIGGYGFLATAPLGFGFHADTLDMDSLMCHGGFIVEGDTSLQGSLLVGTTVVITGRTTLTGGLTVTGSTLLGTITASGTTTFNSLSVTNNFTVGGTTTLTLAANTITATSIATGAITAAKFASNAITSTVLAADAIGSSQLATTAVNEITAATDSVLSASHGAGAWGGGSSSGSGAFLVTVTVSDTHATLVPNANVRLTNGINSYVALSNSSGVASFSLDGATYSRSITKSGYTFTPDSITVSASDNFNAVITANVIPAPPSNPSMCRVFGYVRNQRTGLLMPNVQVRAHRLPPVVAKADGILIGYEDSVNSDNTGLFTLDLFKNTEITPALSTWVIEIPAVGYKSPPLTLTTSTYDLEDLIV